MPKGRLIWGKEFSEPERYITVHDSAEGKKSKSKMKIKIRI